MELLNFLTDEPVMAWFAFLTLLLIVVPAASVLWRRMSGRSQDVAARQPVHETKPVRFLGSQTELIIMLVGLLWLLAVIRSAFFG